MAELKSLLSDPEFLDSASERDIWGNALDEPSFLKIAAVASSEGNDMAKEDTFVSDLETLGYYDLEAKYGRQVADNRSKFQEELRAQRKIRDASPSIGDVAVDTGLAATSAITSMVGGLSVAGVGLVGAAETALTGGTSQAELSAGMGELLGDITEGIMSGQSDTQIAKAELDAIEADLDQADSTARMNNKIAAGYSPAMADYERIGEDFLNFGERFYKDPYVAGNLIAGALGSVWPSSKLAQGGVLLAEKLTARIASKKLQKGAVAVGSSVGIGFAEASGTFTDAQAFVMGLSEEDMYYSPEYQVLRSEGKSHEQAQSAVATLTATEASARQLPTAAVLGLIASKFNANPFKTFKGKGTVGYFQEVGLQTLEEGAQGITSTYNRNVAIQHQVDEDFDVGAGLGESLGEGMFAGAGMAGVIGAPSLARTGAAAAIRGAVNVGEDLVGGTSGQIAKDMLKRAGTAGAGGLDLASRGAKKVAERVAPVTAPIAKAAKERVVDPLAAKAKRVATRPSRKAQTKVMAAAMEAEAADPDNKVLKAVVRVTQMIHKTRVEDMTEKQILGSAAVIGALEQLIPGFEGTVRDNAKRVVASKDVAAILVRVKEIDLNKTHKADTVITPEVVAETLAVAVINPGNVNPEVASKVLKHKLIEDASPEHVKALELAIEISTALNTRQGDRLTIKSEEDIALEKTPEPDRDTSADEELGDAVSRSFKIEGFKGLPSVGDLAANILQGAQSPDGTFNVKGKKAKVRLATEQLRKLVTHMRNKVEALNQSITVGGGASVQFESLVDGKHMVPSTHERAAKGVVYHKNSPGSEANAKRIHSDAVKAAEVYNAMVRAYPKLFQGGEITIADLLPGNTEATPTTTVAEASKETRGDATTAGAQAEAVVQEPGADAETEAEKKRELKTPDTTAVDEASPDAEEPTTQTPETTVVEEDADAEGSRPQAKVADEADTQTLEEPDDFISREERDGPVTEKFAATFEDRGDEIGYENGNDILNLLTVGTNTTQGYRKLAKQVFNKLMKGANSRLRDVLKGSKDDRSIQKQILDGDDLTYIRDFKNTMLVDPQTGEYDHDLLSIAVVTVIDWLSAVRSADPSKKALRKRLELLGITLADLTTEEFNNILHGVSPRFVSEALGKQVIRMWNLKVSPKSQLNDARGAAEGLIKELLTVLTNDFDFISMHEIPIIIKGSDQKFITTQTMNVKGLKDIQTEIGLDGQNSVQKLLTPEDDSGPSVGERIQDVPKKNKRGTSDLSKTEQRAVRVQQDTPHLLAKGVTGLIGAIGFDIYSTMLGWIDPGFLAKNHPLRNSIEGKNLSIERDWDDAHALTAVIEGKAIDGVRTEEMPVYFRIAVTKAGRHQATGANSQSNKTLRVMVSPTNNVLDMTNQDDIDGFWLTVAQASGLGGKFKVENVPHEQILNGIQDAFNAKYGDAVKMIEEYLDTGKLDSEAFYEATGFKEMNHIQKLGVPEILNSIYSVASLNQISRKTNALTEFYVTMGFELDGKTDGPAHMLVNMGQGLLTPQDYENLKRVGYFVGDQDMTLNTFYDGGGQDLYNLGAQTGMIEMYAEMAESGPAMKEALYASSRFATIFGNFKIGEDGLPEMTRDTTKNPMTQVVYGAGLSGVAAGIAEDMLIEFYRKMATVLKGEDAAEFLGYPTLAEDFELLFGTKYDPKTDWTHSWLDRASVATFTDIVTEGIGAMIGGAAKTVMGEKITATNDLLVFITNVQTEFMIALYNRKVLEKAEERASQAEGTEGWIARHKTTKKGISSHLMVSDYQAIVDEVKAFGPTYDNGVQTLTIGLFSSQPTKQELSSNMDGDLHMKSTMLQPEVARVKVIPYLTQGRGDAMVVNEIYGGKNPPEGTLMVHDGLYVKIKDIKKYAKLANEAVMKVWERDVLGDVVEDFEKFVSMVASSGDIDLVRKALATTLDQPYTTTVKAKTINALMVQLKEAHRQNQARKSVFQVVPKSVDHLAGGAEAAKSGPDVKMDRTDINELIADKLNEERPDRQASEQDDELGDFQDDETNDFIRAKVAADMQATMATAAKKDNTEIILPPQDKADKEEGLPNVVISDTDTIMETLLKSSNRLTIRKTMRALVALLGTNKYRVVISNNINDLTAQYKKDKGGIEVEDQTGSLGWTDLDTKVMYILSNTHETLAHELIHLTTFLKVEDHYSGKKTNDAVVRLETLMEEFLAIDFADSGKTLRSAAASAKNQIVLYSGMTSAFGKAAALNEFMAWTLTNAALVKDLSARDTNLVQRLTKAALILIKRLLGNKLPNDMYSHILFNTTLLSEVWTTIAEDTTPAFQDLRKKTPAEEAASRGSEEFSPALIEEIDEDTDLETHAESIVTDAQWEAQQERKRESARKIAELEQKLPIVSEIEAKNEANLDDLLDTEDTGGNNIINDGGDTTGGDGNGVTPAADAMTNFWIDLIKQKLADAKAGLDAEVLSEQLQRYRDAAVDAVKKLEFGGFTLTGHQKRTFKAIHMVLATEMRLNVNSSVALNKMFEHITTELKPEMFGKGKFAQERYSAVMELLGDTKNDEGVSDAIAVLLALSQTSDGFRKALDQIPDPQKDTTTDGSLNEVLTVAAGLLMNKAVGTIDIDGKNAKEMMDVLAGNLIREDQTNEYVALRALTASITRADKFVSGALNALAERMDPIDRAVQESERSKLTKIIVGTVAGAANFVSSHRSGDVADLAVRVSHMGVALDHAVFIREFVTEIVGTTKTNTEVVALLDRTNYKVSGIRQDLKEGVPVALQNAFETHPDADQWKAVFTVLAKLDFAHLFSLANPERAFRLLKDNNDLSAKTVASEDRINKAFPKKVAAVILEKAKQLGAHMNLKGPSHQLWQNAYAINKLAGAYDPKMTREIDSLVSLYALEIADQTDKDTVIQMFENDREATMNLVTYMQALNIEEDMKVISEKARMNGAKGWVPDHGKKNNRLILANDNEAEALERTGWVRRGDYLAEDKWSSESWGYYSTTVRQGGNYSQGVLQSIQETYRGVNSTSGLSVDPRFFSVISGAEADAITDELNDGTGVADDTEALVPFYDEEGAVLSYMRYMNPDKVEEYTKPRQNLALMLGAWAGRQMEEKMASQYNYELLVELKRIYDARGAMDDGLFIDMSKSKDPIFKDTWDAISWETRLQIKSIFGKNAGFMIQKSMVNLSLGYRDPSIMDIWSGKTRMPEFVQDVIKGAVSVIPGNQAVAVLSRTEEAVQGAVATAKDIIVVRSLIVPYMNTQANVFQLLGRGVGLKQMKRGYDEKIVELERFNENTKKLIELKMKVALAGNDKNKQAILLQQAQVIADENTRMGIWPLIQAGQYKNISEGITDLDVDLMSGRMAEWVEAQVNKLPGTVQTIAKYGLLSKDTAIYKMANKAVQYGDFLAKSILYDHYMENGLDHETALRKINEEFVNFSVLPGRMRTGLESIGATWFLSFKIRIMKVAMNQLRENPVRALITAGTIGEYGSPGNDNLVSVAAQGRLGWSLGWTMLLGAPELNPYVNMLGVDEFVGDLLLLE